MQQVALPAEHRTLGAIYREDSTGDAVFNPLQSMCRSEHTAGTEVPEWNLNLVPRRRELPDQWIIVLQDLVTQ